MSATPRARVLGLLVKELQDLRRNRSIVVAMSSLPLVFISLMIGLNVVLRRTASSLPSTDDVLRNLSAVPGLAASHSSALGMQVLLNDQFMFFLLLVPVILPTVIAAHSIVAEKQARTLEPLLASPLTTMELLLAKVAAAVLPSVAIGYLAYLLAIAGVAVGGGPDAVRFLVRPVWSLGVPVIGPLLALGSTLVSVIISSRVNDVRSAQALSGLTALPLIGGGVTVLIAQKVLGPGVMVTAAAVLLPLDVALLALAVRTFRRESILTRWR